MKKYLFVILPVFVLLFGFYSKAETLDDVINYLNSEGFTISLSASSKLQDQVNAANNYYNNSFGIAYVLGGSGSNQAINIGLVPKATVDLLTYSGGKWKYNNTNNNYNCQCTIYYCSGSNGSYTVNNEWLSDNNTSVNISMTPVSKYGKYDFVPPIDWDTVYYSANILPPDLDITYRELSSVPIVDVPLNVELVAEPQNVYVEIGAVFDCPIEVDAYSDNGVYSYHSLDTIGFATNIIDKEDLVLASSASSSYIHLALNEAWQDIYDQIPMAHITWHTDTNYSTNLVNNMKSRFENIRKVCCFYGNELKLFVRYFVINNDTQFIVGSWRIWNSKTPNSYTDQTPTWYQPYIPASGTTGTSTNTGSNTQQDPDVITIPPGSGDPTGIYYNPSTNITVGSNVPNYPDYPTIRSYNADNFLVQTMNYLDYLNNEESEKTLFGEFGHFLASLFVFIPGEIWTIIAVGFSLVIIVMFLKIL